MNAIPSLVATSTVGVAATGLAFGKTQQGAPPRPLSRRRIIRPVSSIHTKQEQLQQQYEQRPATSSTFYTQSEDAPSATSVSDIDQVHRSSPPPWFKDEIPHTIGKRGSATRNQVIAVQYEDKSSDAAGKDSVSSRGSWYRRLSSLQLSQSSDSPRSSLGPDSPSLNLSYASTASILNPSALPSTSAPNKLVKRAYSGKETNGTESRSRMPTLRRPATSHQRSVTLQQRFKEQEQETINVAPRAVSTPESSRSGQDFTSTSSTFHPYFVSQRREVVLSNSHDTSRESNAKAFVSISQHVSLPQDLEPPILMQATSISGHRPSAHQQMRSPSTTLLPSPLMNPYITSEPHAGEKPKRSLSRHLHRLARAGSVRSGKTVTDNDQGSQSTAQITPTSTSSRNDASRRQSTTIPQGLRHIESSKITTNKRDSQFQKVTPYIDAHTAMNTPQHVAFTPAYSPTLSTSSFSSDDGSSFSVGIAKTAVQMPALRVRKERSKSAVMPSTTAWSDRSTKVRSMTARNTPVPTEPENPKDITDTEDAYDYQIGNAFDSYKTTRTGSTRVRSPMLESLFDTSPISVTDYSSTRTVSDYTTRLAYQDGSDRIMEEDENMLTPRKQPRFEEDSDLKTPTKHAYINADALRSSPPNFSLATRKYGRLSFDDDEEDEDWTKDDEIMDLEGSLSPPSTFNSTRVNPALRQALAASSGNVDNAAAHSKSVFDWSEPRINDKSSLFGGQSRPRTVHGKQARDGRGGRATSRARPNVLHVRSQSVPVVPLATDSVDSKSKKFGTWGLGAKGVSEDWDNDFDFDICEDDDENDTSQMGPSMIVPESIQASQASVVGHVGQIREVCLLVEDLRRLRSLAKEKGILDGKYATLWRQADGIIALAAPEEEEKEEEAVFTSPRGSVANDDALSSSRESSYDSTSENDIKSRGSNSRHRLRSRRSSRLFSDGSKSRRSSVFSLDDNIFGVAQSIEEPELSSASQNNVAVDFARFVMEDIHQHRVVSDPQFVEATNEIPDKMPFDTTSLRDLVARASALSRTLSDIIRKHDEVYYGAVQYPIKAQVYGRDTGHRDSSPAFVRVFTPDEFATPPPLPRSQSHNGALTTSGSNSSFLSDSPTRALQQRMRLMTVN